MFNKIFIERPYLEHPQAKIIMDKFRHSAIVPIDKIEDIWGRTKKPYLQKRDNLNLFLGEKKGRLVKEAPDAYGVKGEKHFYFIHAYNCIYECEYCYLQGYFHTPDIVLFLNHQDIISEMEAIVKKNPDEVIWFHAGEFSDSLALTHMTNELPIYWSFFERYPKAKLELRTKSVNTKELLKLNPMKNITVSFSLSPLTVSKEYDKKTPGTALRLKAIAELYQKGFQIGIHFDPIIYTEEFESAYEDVIGDLAASIELSRVQYLSLGVVRFTKDVYREVQKNYPETKLLSAEFIKSFDNKIRYNRPMRQWIMNKVKAMLMAKGMPEKTIYLCME